MSTARFRADADARADAPARKKPLPTRAGAVGERRVRSGGSEDRGAHPHVPAKRSLPALVDAAQSCHGCGLWEHATQTVFGEGPAHAEIVFVGEQPGNDEDLQGHPFVGPAGRVFDASLTAAGIDRAIVYVTNAVKHFKWEPKGKRRLHKRPSPREIWACRPWLDAELETLRPKAVVCLGATAAQALLGRDVRVTKQRGQLMAAEFAPIVMVTVHPASILRAATPEDQKQARAQFIDDLRVIARALKDA